MIINKIHHITELQLRREIQNELLVALAPIMEENRELQQAVSTYGITIVEDFKEISIHSTILKAAADLDWTIYNLEQQAKALTSVQSDERATRLVRDALGPHPPQ
jgi:hypothetical protein